MVFYDAKKLIHQNGELVLKLLYEINQYNNMVRPYGISLIFCVRTKVSDLFFYVWAPPPKPH